jgi:selenocysteine lyase/cysteine desulfurase
VDGAHAFGHFPFTRNDLECDYYGSSLHKWMLAPIGTGLLYVRKSKQKSIWPLMAASPAMDEDIRKYEEIGTHPAANHNAIAAALAFHRAIGGDRKIARLRYLRDRWAQPLVAASSRVKLWTPVGENAASGAIGLIRIEGVDPVKLAEHLWDKDRIVVVAITHAQFQGIRVTPNVYTTPDEVDVFVDAMKRVLAKGV